jgi:polyhydroxyalkanoate synthesis repressor PhaR
MTRLIRRYGSSRKLYDPEESRYVSLEEIERWVREGQEVRVVDNTTSEDVTAQTLAQVIYEGARRGGALFSTEFLHSIIRRGGRVVSTRVGELQAGVDRLVRTSVGRMGPVRRVGGEIHQLRRSLNRLEDSLGRLEEETPASISSSPRSPVVHRRRG